MRVDQSIPAHGLQYLIGIALAHDTITVSREVHLVFLGGTAIGWDDVSCRNIERQPVDDRIIQGAGATILCTYNLTSKQWNSVCT